jgi:uncharacterized protein
MRPVTCSVQASALLLLVTAPALAESGQTLTKKRVLMPAGEQQIAGDFWLPSGAGPFPAVILIPGGGPESGPSRMKAPEGLATLGTLAPRLAANGIAALLVIPRGSADLTIEDRASDVLAAHAYLGKRPEIARTKIGLCGHSLGGIVAPIAVARSRDFAFLILLAGPCTSLSETTTAIMERVLRSGGADDAEIAQMRATLQGVFTSLTEGKSLEPHRPALIKVFESHYARLPEEQKKKLGSAKDFAAGVVDRFIPKTAAERFLLSYEPRPTFAKVFCPVLALFAEKDPKVSLRANREPLLTSLPKGRDHTAMLIPGTDHMFQDLANPSTPQLAPGFADIISGWILSRVGQPTPRAGTR